MEEEDVVNTHTHTHTHTMGYYTAIKKDEIIPCAKTWMNLESIMLTEINQTEKDNTPMMSLVCET